MNATPFLLVCLATHALAVCGFIMSPRLYADTLGKGMLAYFIIMAVWAAGLLLQPVKII